MLKINNILLDYLKSDLIPASYLITPNIPEAEKICGLNINNLDDMVVMAQMIQKMGQKRFVEGA